MQWQNHSNQWGYDGLNQARYYSQEMDAYLLLLSVGNNKKRIVVSLSPVSNSRPSVAYYACLHELKSKLNPLIPSIENKEQEQRITQSEQGGSLPQISRHFLLNTLISSSFPMIKN